MDSIDFNIAALYSSSDIIGHLSWPVATIIALWILKKPISKLIENIHITKKDKDGNTYTLRNTQSTKHFLTADNKNSAIESAPSSISDESSNPNMTSSSTEDFESRQPPIIVKYKHKIFNELVDARAIEYKASREDTLLHLLIDTWFAASFEKIYNTIFGSQLKLLALLAQIQQDEEIDLRKFYDDAINEKPDFYQNYPYGDWINYLIANELVIRHDDNISITEEGREFLSYVYRQGYSTNRPG